MSHTRDVPGWAGFFSIAQFNFFIDLITKYFEDKKCKLEIKDNVAYLVNNDLGPDLNNFGLVNLAGYVQKIDQTRWPEIISGYFEKMIQNVQFVNNFRKSAGDFEKVKQYLGVRISTLSSIDNVGRENAVYDPIVDDLIALLIFDLPETVMSVETGILKSWGKQKPELFNIGLKNINSNYKTNAYLHDFKDFKFWVAYADHFFAPNIILDKNMIQKYTGTYGALIGIPTRNAVLIYPIENTEIHKALNGLISVITGMYNNEPGSLSDKLYWYNGKEFLKISFLNVKGSVVLVEPPTEFKEMIQKLK